uniref:Uncharacterized protein n=1 Tax=Oryctolagus cuniculus TaxID=9986 RepID=A0A5F9CKF4_RABIT
MYLYTLHLACVRLCVNACVLGVCAAAFVPALAPCSPESGWVLPRWSCRRVSATLLFSDSPGPPKGEKGEEREKTRKKEKGLKGPDWKPEAGLSPSKKTREEEPKSRYFPLGWREGAVFVHFPQHRRPHSLARKEGCLAPGSGG